jgi:CubicO group peptidase (beta-lactamase class C family)
MRSLATVQKHGKTMVPLPAVAILVFCLAGCESSITPGQGTFLYEYRVPDETGDGWETTSLTEVGLDKSQFIRLMRDLRNLAGQEVHSILVVRNGRLVFEEYFDGRKFSLAQYTGGTGFDRDDTHNLASVTKSFTTTLVGIAIDQGHIESVDEPVFDFFPEHADLLLEDPTRAYMTVKDLLLMMSGISWNDLGTYSYDDPRNDLVQMFTSDDPIRYALSRDLYVQPGTLFDYCNANTNILGEIVARTTGQRLDFFAQANLFDPLGIIHLEWQMMPNDVVFASGDLRLRPRDMAKFGELFLRLGMWGGQQVVSQEWAELATERLVVELSAGYDWADAYGYGWWHWDLFSDGRTYQTYQASGWGGQWIIVIPEHEMVVASTGGNYYQDAPMPAQRMLTEYVLPAVQ